MLSSSRQLRNWIRPIQKGIRKKLLRQRIKYNKGDTLILQVDFIAQRGTKNGNIRQYYLNAVLPE